MLFGETVAVYCENHMEHTNTLCGQNVEFWYVNANVYISKNVGQLHNLPPAPTGPSVTCLPLFYSDKETNQKPKMATL
jgi:hypothetical protein